MGADPAGGEVDERHVGRGTVGGDVRGGDLDARPGSAGVAAMRQIALTKWDWATLLKRVWGFDVLACTGCGGRMRFTAVIKDRAVFAWILQRLRVPHTVPRSAGVQTAAQRRVKTRAASSIVGRIDSVRPTAICAP
jgi:hypothetical protein